MSSNPARFGADEPGPALHLSDATAVAAGTELVDWVDEHDQVIGVVTRERMRREGLLHRAVYVVVFDAAGRVVVHQRAPWKDVWPGVWDVAFGGVLAAGEDYALAARRELAEEAGLTAVVLTPLGSPVRYRGHGVDLHGRVFWTRSGEPIRPVDGEVVALDTVGVTELAGWAAAHELCPDSRNCVLPLVNRVGGSAPQSDI
ncbi:MAG: NUDIX hydrolase [Acidimicrobiales bacterium]